MPRFFFAQEKISGLLSSVILSQEEFHHLKVMKLKPGDNIYLIDGSGYQYKAQIITMGMSTATVKILAKESISKSPSLKIILGQAIPRFPKIEFILQKATELGVNNICPLKTERSFLAKDKNLSQNRWHRWERIVLEAAKQSGRTCLPELFTPQTLDSFLEQSKDVNLKLCLWEDEGERKNLKSLLRGFRKAESVSILIGPEGSFSRDEIEKIKASGYKTVLCGPRIMRVETAAIACISICQYEWGDL